MGQQQSVASSTLRRLFLVLTVAALMAVMMAASAMPAFAQGPPPTQNHPWYHACNNPAHAPSYCE